MSIIKTDKTNIHDWVNLSLRLFPEHTFNEMFQEYMGYLTNKNVRQKEIGFLYNKNNKNVAFMNISIRNDYVNGCDSSPVVYIEAIYVLPKYRKMGIASELIKTAEIFAREKGILQVASDCLIDNTESEMFHKGCGFKEAERVICFVKNIQ